MLTASGPMVLEYNCRFGDPETQALLPLLKSDLYDILLACSPLPPSAKSEFAMGSRGLVLSSSLVKWEEALSSCTVVIASEGYPSTTVVGRVVGGLDLANQTPGVTVYHAGTKAVLSAAGERQVVSSGGRVLAVTGVGHSLREAKRAAYSAVQCITLEGGHYRKDIGNR